jgi:hypothetical protein
LAHNSIAIFVPDQIDLLLIVYYLDSNQDSLVRVYP